MPDLFPPFFLIIAHGQVVHSNSEEDIEQDEVAHDEQNQEVEHEGASKASYATIGLKNKVDSDTTNVDDIDHVENDEEKDNGESYLDAVIHHHVPILTGQDLK